MLNQIISARAVRFSVGNQFPYRIKLMETRKNHALGCDIAETRIQADFSFFTAQMQKAPNQFH